MSKRFLRAYTNLEDARAGKPGEPIRFTASTEGIKRDGKSLSATDWHLANYLRNPVFLWVHDYFGERPPIGRVAEVKFKENSMISDVIFDQEDTFAKEIEGKYRRGFLNAVSVGWDDIEVEGRAMNDLLDISAVPVPGDPDALMERQYRMLRGIMEEQEPQGGAIPPHSTGIMPEDASWAADIVITENNDTMRSVHAYMDEDGFYKLPHHELNGKAVWRGVAKSMVRLFLGIAQIPDEQRRGVYNHLRRHYLQFDKEPPEFLEPTELDKLNKELIAGLFYEGEPDIFPSFFEDVRRTNKDKIKEVISLLSEIIDSEPETEPQDGELSPQEIEQLEEINSKLGEFENE